MNTAAHTAPASTPRAVLAVAIAAGVSVAVAWLAWGLAQVDAGLGAPRGADRWLAEPAPAAVASVSPEARAGHALAARPIDGRALRLLVQADAGRRGGDAANPADADANAGGDALLARAVARAPRDRMARALALDRALVDSRFDEAALHLDALLRVDPALQAQLLPQLLPSLASAPWRQAVVARLAMHPAWRGAFIKALATPDTADAPPHAEAAAALLAELDTRSALDDDERTLRTRVLQQLGRVGEARDLWLASLPADQRAGAALLANGGFETTPSSSPFDWQWPELAGAATSRDDSDAVDGTASLLVAFSGRDVRYDGPRQLLALPAGHYRLQASTADDTGTHRAFEWQLACDGGPVLLALPLPPSTGTRPRANWQSLGAMFEVPPGCPAQTLRLHHTGRTMEERRLRGTLRIDNVAIIPASGG